MATNGVNDCTLDSVKPEHRALYHAYLDQASSEATLSGPQWEAWWFGTETGSAVQYFRQLQEEVERID
jgi:hypothetical protein